MFKFILSKLGWCPCCQCFFHYPKRRRLNTQYADEEQNWVTCCKPQYEELFEYYKERWEDYYASIRFFPHK